MDTINLLQEDTKRGETTMEKIRVVHYINQFFANIGGEEMADIKPIIKEGAIGPGIALQNNLKENYQICNFKILKGANPAKN